MATVAKQWQSNTSACFHPGGVVSDRLLGRRVNIKFCAKFGKTASKTLKILTEANGATAMKISSVCERHKRFKEGREDMCLFVFYHC